MKQKVWTEDYKITSYLVNLRGKAGLYAILNLIQDVGWAHAVHLRVKLNEGSAWVFTRQQLIMREWPSWNETVSIRTWLRPPGDEAFILRDYEIFLGDRKIGECTSTFTVMDTKTRKIAPVDWSFFEGLWQTENLLSHRPEKIAPAIETEDLAQFEVRNSDIDLNRHVNNTRYAQWILDAIPIDILRGDVHLEEYLVNFLAETKIGDLVSVQKSKQDVDEGDFQQVQFQGIRVADGTAAFTARMKIRAR